MSSHPGSKQEMLSTLKNRLSEGELRRKKELAALKGLTKAVMQINERNEHLPPIRDLMLANTVVECKAKTAQDALRLMKEGNAKFLKHGTKALLEREGPHPLDLHLGQRPHAVLVTCSDSRVPPELVFSCGLGELFVVRVAGNAVDTLARASILYALEHLHAPLVVVMGHESCGAVQASLLSDEKLKGEPSDIVQLVQNIRGSLKTVTPADTDDEKLLAGVVCNVHQTVKTLKSHPDVANMVARKDVLVVGAYYSFNGCVTFFGEGASTGSEPSIEVASIKKTSPASPAPTLPKGNAPSATPSPAPSPKPQQRAAAEAGAAADGRIASIATKAATSVAGHADQLVKAAKQLQAKTTSTLKGGLTTLEHCLFSPTSIWFFVRVILLIAFLRVLPLITESELTPTSMVLWGVFDLVVVTTVNYFVERNHGALLAHVAPQ